MAVCQGVLAAAESAHCNGDWKNGDLREESGMCLVCRGSMILSI